MRVLMLACALVLAAPAYADDQFCFTQAKIGETVMTARLSGVPLSKMLEVNRQQDLTPLELTLYDEIVIRAYQRPDYRSEEAKSHAIGEYGNETMLACMQGMRADQ